MIRYLIISFLLLHYSTVAQTIEELKKQALVEADIVARASISQNVDAILKHTHPKILAKYGRETLKSTIREVFATMDDQNFSIEDSTIKGVSQIKKENDEYRCLVLNQIHLKIDGRSVKIKSSLFGFYDQKIAQWYFVESNKLINDPETKQLFQNFSTTIDIPSDELLN